MNIESQFIFNSKLVNSRDVNFLNQFIKYYLNKVSFNNLEVYFNKGKILDLSIENLLDKVIVKNLGGYCFEHNKIFNYLLLEYGFNVVSYLGRVVYGQEIETPRTHHTNVVVIKGVEYIVDVGFGPYTPGCLIPLSGEVVSDGHFNYFVKMNQEESLVRVFTYRDNEEFELYNFRRELCFDCDYKLSNYYTNTHPDSKFVNEVIVSQKKSDEVKFISNNILSSISKSGRVDIDIKDHDHFVLILKNDFNLEFSSFIKED